MEHSGLVNAATFSPDGRWIATRSDDRALRLWRVGRQPLLRTLPHNNWVRGVAFSPDGARLLTGTAGIAPGSVCQLWDTASGTRIGEPLPQPAWVHGVGFGPDGNIAYGLSHWNTNPQLHRWDLANCRLLSSANGHPGDAWRLAVGPGAVTLVTGGGPESAAYLWDGATGQIRGEPLRHDHGTTRGGNRAGGRH
jgi:WD40 repeat protein